MYNMSTKNSIAVFVLTFFLPFYANRLQFPCFHAIFLQNCKHTSNTLYISLLQILVRKHFFIALIFLTKKAIFANQELCFWCAIAKLLLGESYAPAK